VANLSHGSPVHSGSASIGVTYTAAWGGLYLHTHTPIDSSGYDRLRFYIHGGATGGQELRIVANGINPGVPVTASANQWTQAEVLLSALGGPATLTDLYWQDSTGGTQPVFYLDDIVLVASTGTPTPTPPPGAGPALTVNVAANRRPISPNIYGMNFAPAALADELDLPVNRWGGNATSRYNWQTDISNHASDWYFENIKESDATNLPADSAAIRFIEQNRNTNTDTLLTLPMMGYVSSSNSAACGFSIAKYGAQTGNDWQWRPDCGNGTLLGGAPVAGNDPLDTSIVITQSFVADWVNYLEGRYGAAGSGGVRFYNLDNEPGLWSGTHRDVHPNFLTYDEIHTRTIQYAVVIKAADPSALILGPVQDGWTRYWYASYDGSGGPIQDRQNHGNTPFAPWFMEQLYAYEQLNGVRLLDYLDLHYYPQAAGVTLSPAGSADTQALRLRSTRSLWDPTYADESWINGTEGGPAVRLIPRMRAWVNAHYPGTRLAITEYNWGALDHLNGALAQADVLGIFGREGLDLATLWAPPTATQPGAFAFRTYRNYDGAGSKFGDMSVDAASADQGQLAIYAAQRSSDFALTLMVINKASIGLTSSVTISGFSPGVSAQVYRYSAANLNAILAQPNQALGPTGFTAAFPPSSITLFVVPLEPPGGLARVYLPVVVR
jgi:hypothetical protein